MTCPRIHLSITVSMFHQVKKIYSSIIIWILFATTNAQLRIAAVTDTNNSTSAEMIEDISVRMNNSTSILLSWKIEYNFLQNLRLLAVWHRPRSDVDSDQPRLEYDDVTDHYIARYGIDKSQYDWKSTIYTKFFREPEISEENEMLIYTGNLFADMKYEFIIHRIALSSEFGHRTAQIFAKTTIPPVKTGAGCFHVVDVGSTTRKVQFFWRGFNEPGEYEIEIREEGSRFNEHQTVLVERGALVRAAKEITISKKRHWFIIRRHEYPEAGESVVNIPPQDDILKERANLHMQWKESEGEYTLTWKKPESVNVANYTILWMGIRRRRNQRVKDIMDIIHLPGDQTSFVVNSDEHVILFWAANTDSTSTGLRTVEHYKLEPMGLKKYFTRDTR